MILNNVDYMIIIGIYIAQTHFINRYLLQIFYDFDGREEFAELRL